MTWVSARGVPFYDEDDPPFQPRPHTMSGLGSAGGVVLGREAGEPLPANWLPDRPACADSDPNTFFPEMGDYRGAQMAKRVCGRCPMMDACREHNLDERFGIWGGTTAMQRRVLRKRRELQQINYTTLLD